MRYLLIFLLILASCREKPNPVSSLPVEPQPRIQYMYTAIDAEVPEYDDGEIIHKEVRYASPIQEVKDLNEDTKYMIMDQYESVVTSNLKSHDSRTELDVQMHTFEQWERDFLYKQCKSHITKRSYEIFDSYKDASIQRRINLGEERLEKY